MLEWATSEGVPRGARLAASYTNTRLSINSQSSQALTKNVLIFPREGGIRFIAFSKELLWFIS